MNSSCAGVHELPDNLQSFMRIICPVRPLAAVQGMMLGSLVAGNCLNWADMPETRAVFAPSFSGTCNLTLTCTSWFHNAPLKFAGKTSNLERPVELLLGAIFEGRFAALDAVTRRVLELDLETEFSSEVDDEQGLQMNSSDITLHEFLQLPVIRSLLQEYVENPANFPHGVVHVLRQARLIWSSDELGNCARSMGLPIHTKLGLRGEGSSSTCAHFNHMHPGDSIAFTAIGDEELSFYKAAVSTLVDGTQGGKQARENHERFEELLHFKTAIEVPCPSIKTDTGPEVHNVRISKGLVVLLQPSAAISSHIKAKNKEVSGLYGRTDFRMLFMHHACSPAETPNEENISEDMKRNQKLHLQLFSAVAAGLANHFSGLGLTDKAASFETTVLEGGSPPYLKGKMKARNKQNFLSLLVFDTIVRLIQEHHKDAMSARKALFKEHGAQDAAAFLRLNFEQHLHKRQPSSDRPCRRPELLLPHPHVTESELMQLAHFAFKFTLGEIFNYQLLDPKSAHFNTVQGLRQAMNTPVDGRTMTAERAPLRGVPASEESQTEHSKAETLLRQLSIELSEHNFTHIFPGILSNMARGLSATQREIITKAGKDPQLYERICKKHSGHISQSANATMLNRIGQDSGLFYSVKGQKGVFVLADGLLGVRSQDRQALAGQPGRKEASSVQLPAAWAQWVHPLDHSIASTIADRSSTPGHLQRLKDLLVQLPSTFATARTRWACARSAWEDDELVSTEPATLVGKGIVDLIASLNTDAVHSTYVKFGMVDEPSSPILYCSSSGQLPGSKRNSRVLLFVSSAQELSVAVRQGQTMLLAAPSPEAFLSMQGQMTDCPNSFLPIAGDELIVSRKCCLLQMAVRSDDHSARLLLVRALHLACVGVPFEQWAGAFSQAVSARLQFRSARSSQIALQEALANVTMDPHSTARRLQVYFNEQHPLPPFPSGTRLDIPEDVDFHRRVSLWHMTGHEPAHASLLSSAHTEQEMNKASDQQPQLNGANNLSPSAAATAHAAAAVATSQVRGTAMGQQTPRHAHTPKQHPARAAAAVTATSISDRVLAPEVCSSPIASTQLGDEEAVEEDCLNLSQETQIVCDECSSQTGFADHADSPEDVSLGAPYNNEAETSSLAFGAGHDAAGYTASLQNCGAYQQDAEDGKSSPLGTRDSAMRYGQRKRRRDWGRQQNELEFSQKKQSR